MSSQPKLSFLLEIRACMWIICFLRFETQKSDTCKKSNSVVWSFSFLWWQLLFIIFCKVDLLPSCWQLCIISFCFYRLSFYPSQVHLWNMWVVFFDNSVVVLFFYSLYKTVNTRLKNIYLSFTSIFQPFDSGMVPGNFKSGCKLFLGHIFHWRSIFFSKLSTGQVGNNLHKNFKILNCSLTLGGRQGSPRDSRPRQHRWLLGQNRSRACNPELANVTDDIYMGIWEHLVAIKHDLPVIRNLPHIRPVWHSEFMFENL